MRGNNKENVWSVDNDLAKVSSQKEKGRGRRSMKKRKKGSKGGGRVIVTGAMLMEVETVLQTQVLGSLSKLHELMQSYYLLLCLGKRINGGHWG